MVTDEAINEIRAMRVRVEVPEATAFKTEYEGFPIETLSVEAGEEAEEKAEEEAEEEGSRN